MAVKKEQIKQKEVSKRKSSSSKIILICAIASLVIILVCFRAADRGTTKLTSSAHKPVGEFIDTENFVSKIISSPEVWALEFWDPTCGGCAEFNPIWARFSRTIRGRKFKFGVVNIGTPKGRQLLFDTLGEKPTLPTVQLYKYIGGRPKHMVDNPIPFKKVKALFKEAETDLEDVKEKGKFYTKIKLTEEKKIQLDKDDESRKLKKEAEERKLEELRKKSMLSEEERAERRRRRHEKYGKKKKKKRESRSLIVQCYKGTDVTSLPYSSYCAPFDLT